MALPITVSEADFTDPVLGVGSNPLAKIAVRFSEAVATMSADDKVLTVEIEAGSDEVLERMKGVVSSHLDRFAFREAPLPFEWQAA